MVRLTLGTCLLSLVFVASASAGNEVDKILNQENADHKVALKAMPQVDDLVFLRRASIDLIGRIPTEAEIKEFTAWPQSSRREKLVDKLLADSRFTDRWTVFFGDMLRLRVNAQGGEALTAFVHQAIADEMPYDQLARRLIITNGRAGKTPEAGFVLADDADPLAMASVTSQVFLGVRIGCAQCHDHPFDVWKREDFYGMAAYYGKTRRYENGLTKVNYTTEMDESMVLWPPDENAKNRQPMEPRFPFEISKLDEKASHVAKFRDARAALEAKKLAEAKKAPTVDDLLDETSSKVATAINGPSLDSEAKSEIRKIDILKGIYRQSELREQLADHITDPRNRYFSRSIVNRVWAELIGRGFVNPVDDFRDDNDPSHLKTMDYVADEFVASGFHFKTLVRMIVTSDVYARAHAPMDSDEIARQELESAFLATPMRVMISEALFDSLVTAGHLFEYKHQPGQNPQVVYETVRVKKDTKPEGKKPKPLDLVGTKPGTKAAMKEPMAMAAPSMMAANARGGSYNLEDAIEVDFKQVLVESAKDDIQLEEMEAMSQEQIEAERMMAEKEMKTSDNYVTHTIKKVYDANPKFNTSLRMPAPAPEGHFLRVFGQTARVDLGESRSQSPSMRQALMMLNGKLTHEASRVGELETMYPLVSGKNADLDKAIKLAYLEIMTRAPSASEVSEGKQIISAAKTPADGMADLRWVLLNCNEFRFIP
jgi:hypothetical protein